MPRGRTVKTPERVGDAIRMRYVDGLTYREIAERFGIGVPTAEQWVNDPDGTKLRARKARYGGTCVDCGTATSGKPAERCFECRNEYETGARGRLIVEMWDEGMSMRDIADALGMRTGTVNTWIGYARKRGVPLRLRILTGRGEVVAARDREIIRLWNAGFSRQQIADRFGFKSAKSLGARIKLLRRRGHELEYRPGHRPSNAHELAEVA